MILRRCLPWTSIVLLLALVASAREPSLGDLMTMMQPALELQEALRRGDGRKALPLAVKNYEMSKRANGLNNPTTLACLGNLAAAQQLCGQYAAAEKTYLSVLPLVEKTPMPRAPGAKADKLDQMEAFVAQQTVINNRKGLYNNLADLYLTMGRLPEAEQYSLKALEFMSQFPDANITAELSVLGGIYLAMGDYAAARKPYEEALDMMLLRVRNGVDKKRGLPYNNLGILEDEAGNADQALAHLREALTIRRESLRDQPHFELALSWTNLGRALMEHRPDSRSEALQALENGHAMGVKVDGASHPETLRKAVPLIRARLIQGQTSQARELLDDTERRVIKGDYPVLDHEIATLRARFAIVTHAPDLPEEMRRLLDRYRAEMGGMMRFSSETRRIGWNRDRSPLDMLVRHGDPLLIAECLLLNKGAVLESVLADRAARQRAAAAGRSSQVEALRSAESELHALREASSMTVSTTRTDRSARRVELEEKVTGLRSQIGIRAEDLLDSLAVTPAQVREQLPEGTTLVDFFVAEPWQVDYSGHRRYGAIVYTVAAPGVRLLDLGSETEINQLIARFRAAILQIDEEAFQTSSRAVYNKLIIPLQQAAPDTKHWLFCPDGELQALPFACVQAADGKFLVENGTITLLTSARALSRPHQTEHPPSPGKVLLVGDVDFSALSSAKKSKTVTPAVARAYAAANLDFVALPGTAEEIRLLEAKAKLAGWNPSTLTGSAATESAFAEAVSGCAVVHLATHGGILPARKDRSQPLELPFYSSFIAMSGAQATLERLKQPGAVKTPPSLDGILTAANAAALPLASTLLVTLSACETGLGTVEKGEGVIGIARALHSAGARHCVATLWPVADDETMEFMQEFYSRVLQGTPPPAALQQAQTACLTRWSRPRGSAQAAYLAGGFVVSSVAATK